MLFLPFSLGPVFIGLRPSWLGGLITGTGPANANIAIEASTDMVLWRYHSIVAANAFGVWQLSEPNTIAPPYRFYRALSAQQLPPGLINWWQADNSYVDSFGGILGTPVNDLGFADGQRGRAFGFDGVGKLLSLGGAPVPVPWTACFWVRREDAVDASSALIADDFTSLKLEQFGSPARVVGFTQFGVADYYFAHTVPTNTWTHVAFVGTADGTALYFNGGHMETLPASISLPRGILGARTTLGDKLNGLLDEITWFNRALTPAEIDQVRNVTRGP